MASDLLTLHGITSLLVSDDNSEPILQVIELKKLQNNARGSKAKYRIVLSDGSEALPTLASSQVIPKIVSGEIREKTRLVVRRRIVNSLPNGRKIVILLDAKVLEQMTVVLGAVSYKDPDSSRSPSASSDKQSTKTSTPSNKTKTGNGDEAGNNRTDIAPTRIELRSNPQFRQDKDKDDDPESYLNQFVYGMKKSLKSDESNPSSMLPKVSIPGDCTPIALLTPYCDEWKIRAKIIKKSDIRTWKNNYGSGQLFTITLMDKEGDCIIGTFFRDDVDKFFPLIKEEQTYFIVGGTIKISKEENQKFTGIRHPFQMVFNKYTIIDMDEDDDDMNINPMQNAKFTPICDLFLMPSGTIVNVLGKVVKYSDIQSLNLRQGGAKKIRNVWIGDESEKAIEVTFWGGDAENEKHYKDDPILALQSFKVTEYRGKSLTSLTQSKVYVNPTLDQCEPLHKWLAEKGDTALEVPETKHTDKPVTNIEYMVRDVKANKDTWTVHDIIGTIQFIKPENPFYLGCPSNSCKRKLHQEINYWRCDNCNKIYNDAVARYILQAKILDGTGDVWATIYGGEGEKVLGLSADDLRELQLANKKNYNQIFMNANHQTWRFKMRSRVDAMMHSNNMLKHSVVSINRVNVEEDIKRMVQILDKYDRV